ncbi:hypothetical protein ABID39_000662, partial [Bartonella japonica]
FDDFYFTIEVNSPSFPLHLASKEHRKIFYSKVVLIRNN